MRQRGTGGRNQGTPGWDTPPDPTSYIGEGWRYFHVVEAKRTGGSPEQQLALHGKFGKGDKMSVPQLKPSKVSEAMTWGLERPTTWGRTGATK